MTSTFHRMTIALFYGSVMCLACGCQPKANTGDTSDAASGTATADHDHDHDDHDHGHDRDHDHGHDHDHAEGPHGGHLLALAAEGSSAQYQAEWLHDDAQGLVTVYLLEGNKPVAAEHLPDSIQIDITSGKTPKTYELAAGEKAGAFELEDPSLLTGLQVIVDGQEPVLRATISGQALQAKFEHHEHH